MKNIYNFGCRMNEFECQCINDIIKKLNIDNDIIFVNTCAVTNESESQVRQKIRKLKRENKSHCLVVSGCSSQLDVKHSFNNFNISNKDLFLTKIGVDFVLDNSLKLKEWVYFLIKYWLKNWGRSEKIKKKMQDIFFSNLSLRSDDSSYEKKLRQNIDNFLKKIEINEDEKLKILSLLDSDCDNSWRIIDNFEGRSRAFVPIQTGCDHFCSFCIVPFSRGKSRSFDVDFIIKQIDNFVKNGYNEIVLTGTDIASYNYKNITLGKLCLKILKKTNLNRLRLSSIDVDEMLEKTGNKIYLDNTEIVDEKKIKDDIIELLKNERFMPYFHISLQSGNNKILHLMRRRHSKYDIIQFCEKVAEIRKKFFKKKSTNIVTFGADIIAGFPNETEEDFEDSKEIVKKYITFVHAFPYSKKKGTLAEVSMKDNVSKEIKKNRVKDLITIGEKKLNIMKKLMNGTTQKMVVENGGIARTENFMKVKVSCNYKIGSIIQKKVYLNNKELVVKD